MFGEEVRFDNLDLVWVERSDVVYVQHLSILNSTVSKRANNSSLTANFSWFFFLHEKTATAAHPLASCCISLQVLFRWSKARPLTRSSDPYLWWNVNCNVIQTGFADNKTSLKHRAAEWHDSIVPICLFSLLLFTFSNASQSQPC